MEELDRRLAVAMTVAQEAGALARTHFENLAGIAVEKKGAQDYVSIADRDVEKLLKERLLTAFPEDGFLGEEFGGAEHEGVWVVDPIDGTHNFLRGIPLFGVSIAYWRGGESLVGVIYDPILDQTYAARKGGGATKNGRPIRVRNVEQMSDALLGIGFSLKLKREELLDGVRGFLEQGAEFRRVGAAVIALAWVAEGRLDGFWEASLNAWDALAGMVLVREAGGVTNRAFEVGALLQRAPTLVVAPGIARSVAEITRISLEGS